MQILANHMYLQLRSNPHVNNAVRFDSCNFKPFACFVFDLDLFLVFPLFRLSHCLCMHCLSTLDYPECEACYYESLEFADHQQGKLHFNHTLLYPVFTMH